MEGLANGSFARVLVVVTVIIVLLPSATVARNQPSEVDSGRLLSESRSFQVVCSPNEALAPVDRNDDAVASVDEIRAVAPDSDELQRVVDDLEAAGYSGIQYRACASAASDTTSLDVGSVAETSVEHRITALEARVDELESRLDDLEARLATLEGNVAPSQAGADRNGGDTALAEGILEVSGKGATVTDDFQLESGRYEVTLTLDSGCCISVFLHGPSGEELLFNEIFDIEGRGGTATNIFEVTEAGAYFIDSQNVDGAWTVTFEKR